MRLDEETWEKLEGFKIQKKEDDTYRTGDPFFDELEEMISKGSNIHDVLSKL